MKYSLNPKKIKPKIFPVIDLATAIGMEAKRLAEKYEKDSFECEDLQKILNIGKGNIRDLMNDNKFPAVAIGCRKVVPALALATWMVQQYYEN